MAYIEGTGNLILGEMASNNTSANRSKDILALNEDLAFQETEVHGYGLRYVDGEILSYITDLKFQPLICSGIGKADNLYDIPKIKLKARFRVKPIILQARFSVGRGN